MLELDDVVTEMFLIMSQFRLPSLLKTLCNVRVCLDGQNAFKPDLKLGTCFFSP